MNVIPSQQYIMEDVLNLQKVASLLLTFNLVGGLINFMFEMFLNDEEVRERGTGQFNRERNRPPLE